ncbi:alcohol dehydrogenase catalytic domain-containing protein, partial [Nocardioides sp.]|uniref:alcohol dehydrogenase catalytic domain-containing protein n=1 Tax=Nocardioides sp. TaxID=35761 RepID=UPI0027205FA0
MRAVRVVRHGEPSEAICVEDVEVPEPGPGQVRVRVAAASLNFGDVARCRGGVNASMAAPPFTLGMDVAGVVEAAGEGMERWLDRRVVGITPQAVGGLAEHALAGTVLDAPPGYDDVAAAAFTLPFHVSWLALHERARLA